MRYLLFGLLLALAACVPSNSIRIDGEIFIVTEYSGTVRFAGSDVYVYRLADVEKMVDDYNLDVLDYLKQLPPRSFDTATADSQGRFSFVLPPGEYALVAIEHRDIVGGRKEFYQWFVKAQPKTMLSNNNLAGRGDSLLPKRFARP